MSRFKSNLYTVERRVWRNHKLCWIQNDDFTLFSGHHKTKIKEEDLPEWYVFGRYLRELASDVGTLQQRLLLAGSVPTVTLVLAKSVMPRDLFLLRNGSVEAEMRLHQKGL